MGLRTILSFPFLFSLGQDHYQLAKKNSNLVSQHFGVTTGFF